MAKRNLFDLMTALDQLEKEVIKEGPKISEEIAINASALAIARIQKEGVAASYSTKRMLATQNMFNRKDRFKPTEITKKDGTKRLLWIKFPRAKKAVPVMVLSGGYKELRSLNGLPTGFVNLTFTGRMFQNVKVLGTKRQGDAFLSVIGVKDLENQKKFAGNMGQYGRFMDPKEKEIRIIQAVPVARLRTIVQKVLA